MKAKHRFLAVGFLLIAACGEARRIARDGRVGEEDVAVGRRADAGPVARALAPDRRLVGGLFASGNVVTREQAIAEIKHSIEKTYGKRGEAVVQQNFEAVDQTLALGPELGIQSTPTLVLPNGLVMPGYKTADELIKRIREESTAAR